MSLGPAMSRRYSTWTAADSRQCPSQSTMGCFSFCRICAASDSGIRMLPSPTRRTRKLAQYGAHCRLGPHVEAIRSIMGRSTQRGVLRARGEGMHRHATTRREFLRNGLGASLGVAGLALAACSGAAPPGSRAPTTAPAAAAPPVAAATVAPLNTSVAAAAPKPTAASTPLAAAGLVDDPTLVAAARKEGQLRSIRVPIQPSTMRLEKSCRTATGSRSVPCA